MSPFSMCYLIKMSTKFDCIAFYARFTRRRKILDILRCRILPVFRSECALASNTSCSIFVPLRRVACTLCCKSPIKWSNNLITKILKNKISRNNNFLYQKRCLNRAVAAVLIVLIATAATLWILF